MLAHQRRWHSRRPATRDRDRAASLTQSESQSLPTCRRAQPPAVAGPTVPVRDGPCGPPGPRLRAPDSIQLECRARLAAAASSPAPAAAAAGGSLPVTVTGTGSWQLRGSGNEASQCGPAGALASLSSSCPGPGRRAGQPEPGPPVTPPREPCRAGKAGRAARASRRRQRFFKFAAGPRRLPRSHGVPASGRVTD